MRTLTRRGLIVPAMLAPFMGVIGLTRPSGASAQGAAFPARARFLHANTGVEKIEVMVNGTKELDEFAYGQVSDWIEVQPGVVRLTITADRPGINYRLFDTVYPVFAGQDFDVIISDLLVIGAPVDTSSLAADSARVRVINAALDVPPIDIAIKGGATVIAALAYGEQSADADVPAGTNDLEVRVSDTGEVVLDLPGVSIEPGMVYNMVIFGTPGSQDTPLTMTPLVTEARAAGQGAMTATPVS